MLSSPADKDKLLNGVKEISNSLTRVDAERDFQKDAIAKLSDELGIKKQYIAKLSKLYHKQSFSQAQQEYEELEALYEAITA